MDIRLGTEYIDSVYYGGVKVWPMKCVPYTVPADTSVLQFNRPILSECYIDASNVKTITFDNTIFNEYIANEIPLVQDNFTNATPILNFNNNVNEIALVGNGVENICITKYPIEGTENFVYPDIELFHLDGSNNLSGCLFFGANKLRDVRISGLNNILTNRQMFDGCSSLINVELDDLNRTTTTQYMFRDCTNLTNVSFFNTADVAHSGYMFQNCTSLVTVPKFNFRADINMTHMFDGCSSLETFPGFIIEKFNNTYMLKNVEYMFKDCTSLINVTKFETINVKYMDSMFEGCSSIENVPNFNTGNVEYMNSIFSGCSSLINAPSFDMSKVKYADYMFYNCSSLTNVPELDFSNLIVSYYDLMFYNCSSLTNVDGFVNLGQAFTSATKFDLSRSPNLTRQSCLNIFNKAYNVSNKSFTCTIKLHSNVKSLLSSSDIAIATNKGWVIQ